MKGHFLAFAFACLCLVLFAVPARAQNTNQTSTHDYRTESCNRVVNSGFGTNSEALTVKMFVTAHYNMQDMDAVKATYVAGLIDQMNATAAAQGYRVRFQGVDFNSSAAFNFLIFVDAYFDSATGVYTFVFDVHGWGQHHLFTYIGTSADGHAASALLNGGANLPVFFENGWTCKD